MEKRQIKSRFSANAISIDRERKTEDENIIPVRGYACHFGKRNGNGEIVTEESFAKFFDELKKNGLMPVFNLQHTDTIIGGWDRIYSDDSGLVAEGHLNGNVAHVRDYVLPLVDSGDLRGLSTEGFTPWEAVEYDEKTDSLRLNEFILTAISLVGLPADYAAGIEVENRLSLEREKFRKKGKKRANVSHLIY